MAPAQWRKSMVQINFEPMHKTLTEVVEYLERLEVLDATEKKKEPQKKGNDKSENKAKSKSKGHKSSRKGKKSQKKRKRSTDSEASSYEKITSWIITTKTQFSKIVPRSLSNTKNMLMPLRNRGNQLQISQPKISYSQIKKERELNVSRKLV